MLSKAAFFYVEIFQFQRIFSLYTYIKHVWIFGSICILLINYIVVHNLYTTVVENNNIFWITLFSEFKKKKFKSVRRYSIVLKILKDILKCIGLNCSFKLKYIIHGSQSGEINNFYSTEIKRPIYSCAHTICTGTLVKLYIVFRPTNC